MSCDSYRTAKKNEKRNSKGQLPVAFLLFFLVALGIIAFIGTDFFVWEIANNEQNAGTLLGGNVSFNTTSPVIVGNVVNTTCGADVICTLGNMGALFSYSSDYQMFSLIILLPFFIILSLMIVVIIRG